MWGSKEDSDMRVYTGLSKECEILFKEQLEESGISAYALAKKIIEDTLKPVDKIDNVDEITQTGNFEEDVKALDQSGITDKTLKKALEELDHQKKTKNTVKKGGAFHEENCMIDIKSLFVGGKPNFHELKYHMDWWLKVGLITNVLARRGIKMKQKYVIMQKGFESRAENTEGTSTYQHAVTKIKVDSIRRGKYGG